MALIPFTAKSNLDAAISLAQAAIDSAPSNDPLRNQYIETRNGLIEKRYSLMKSMDDLLLLFYSRNQMVDALALDDPDYDRYFQTLIGTLDTHFQRTGLLSTIDRIIELWERVQEDQHANRSLQIAWWSGRRFERSRLREDADRAVMFSRLALKVVPETDPGHIHQCYTLSYWLGKRFEYFASQEDLMEAIEYGKKAIDAAATQGIPTKPAHLTNLGLWFGKFFDRYGSPDDLDQAIDLTMRAGNLLAASDSPRANNLNNLGIWLRRRFELTGSIIDLDNSIRLGEEALEATDRTSLVHCNRQIGLSIRLFRRYDRNRSLLDLERAIKILEDTDERVMDHPLRTGMMHNQARLYRARYQHNRSPSDLRTAFSFAQGAIDHTPEDHPERAARLNNLAGIHLDMFNFSKSLEDLDEAISINNTALESTNPSLRNYTSTLNIRGSLFHKRYLHTGSFDNLEHAKSSYKESWLCVKGKPHERIYAAQQAATILAEHSEWEEAYSLLQPAINLLPLISPHQIQHSDKQYVLKDFPGVASLAAASALQAGRGACEALEILERGRGVISSLILNLRTDISQLVAQFPQLAEEYISLRNELDSPITVLKYNTAAEKASAQETAMRRRRETSVKLEELTERIRANEQFQQFLIEPTIDEFRSAADPDPIVIINVSSYRCDAFIVEKHLVRSIELPHLILSDIQEKARVFRLPGGVTSSQVNSMLEWLWEVAMCPILEALGFGGSPDNDSMPHVWWIPTGSLSHLPLHAAGRHATRSGQTVLDHVMSSYSPSLKALIRGRQHASQPSVDSKRDSIVLVSMSQTPGLSSSGDLRYAAKEVTAIEAICPSLRLSPIQPLQRKQDVLSHLQVCRIFHFAGHSRSDPSDPSQSSLLLEDWETDPFTVGHLRDRNIQGQLPFLGYLSACSTGAVKVEELVDEGIHLISAFRLAGFRHTIGTLWEVSDETCVNIARIFYETIAEQGLNDRAIYLGIHRSVRRLRDVAVEAMYKLQEKIDHLNGKDRPDSDRDAILVGEHEREKNAPIDMHWVPYVHFGV